LTSAERKRSNVLGSSSFQAYVKLKELHPILKGLQKLLVRKNRAETWYTQFLHGDKISHQDSAILPFVIFSDGTW